jgi:large subunit ribosomal protein L11
MKERIKLLVEGGKASPGPATAPRLAAAGIDIGRVFEEINKKTADYAGLRVPVVIEIDSETKSYEIMVGLPPVSSLLKKELGVERARVGEEEKAKGISVVGDLKMEQVVSIARLKLKSMGAKGLKAAVKSVIGTAVSMPVTIEGRDPRDVLREVEEGKWDELIKA